MRVSTATRLCLVRCSAADSSGQTRGMQAALPFIDDFLPVHNLDSLEVLGHHLSSLPPRKGLARR